MFDRIKSRNVSHRDCIIHTERTDQRVRRSIDNVFCELCGNIFISMKSSNQV